MKSGIYKITNTENGKVYIGSAVDFAGRWRNHRWRLRRGDHHSPKLQAAWNKYGEAAFEFSIVEHVPADSLIEREQHWLDALKPFYNVAQTAGSQLGVKRSAEELARMASRAAAISDDTREKMAAAKRGRKASDETRRRMSLARVGQTHSPETRRKLALTSAGKSNALGFRHSEEAKARISAARIGKALSSEHRKKLSDSHMGNTPGNNGRSHSDEARTRMVDAWKRRRERQAATA